MKTAVPVLAPLLRSPVQARILAELLLDPRVELSVSSLADRAGTSFPTALREVRRAEAAEIVSTRRLGNTRLVRANPDNPLYGAVRDIVVATYGPPAVIREELDGLAGVVELYLFGSWAARYSGETGRPPHDIDVLVIGDVDRGAVYAGAERAERRLHVPVQVTIRSLDQWERFIDDPFLTEVHRRPLVSLRTTRSES